MPLPQHIKEWRQAARTTPQDETAKETAFTSKLSQLNQPQGNNTLKDWYQATTVVLAKYQTVSAQDVTEVTAWVNTLRTKLNTQVNQLHQIITPLHSQNPAVGATARQRVIEWIDKLPNARRTLPKVNTLILALKAAGFTDNKRIRSFWLDLGEPMGGDVLATILGDPPQVPAWLDKASRHVAVVSVQQIWIRALQSNREEIVHYASVVYEDDHWQQAAQQVNAVAALWAGVQRAQRLWVDMFNIAQWLEMQDVIAQSGRDAAFYLPKLAEIGELLPAQRKDRDNRAHMVNAALRDMGDWIHHHRELVIELLEKGYSAQVIAEMYTEELEHREIIAATWFRGENIVNNNAADIAFKTAPNVHGFIFANPTHLAERHLYKHFDFAHVPRWQGDDAIKDWNSFFPYGTEQQTVSQLSGQLFVGNQNGLILVQNYMVFIRQSDPKNEHTKRVVSLYPNLANDHRDQYSRDKLERIEAVAAKFATPYSNDKPVIAWRDAPRARR